MTIKNTIKIALILSALLSLTACPEGGAGGANAPTARIADPDGGGDTGGGDGSGGTLTISALAGTYVVNNLPSYNLVLNSDGTFVAQTEGVGRTIYNSNYRVTCTVTGAVGNYLGNYQDSGFDVYVFQLALNQGVVPETGIHGALEGEAYGCAKYYYFMTELHVLTLNGEVLFLTKGVMPDGTPNQEAIGNHGQMSRRQ